MFQVLKFGFRFVNHKTSRPNLELLIENFDFRFEHLENTSNVNVLKHISTTFNLYWVVSLLVTIILRSEDGKALVDVIEIELWRDNAGLSPDWFCDVIFLVDLETGIFS